MTRILGFGEVLLRLSPSHHARLSQAPALELWVGGAEANVVTALAWLGRPTGLVSALPDNELGERARTALRGHGVAVTDVTRAAGRMGLYFSAAGAGLRPAEVLYDRASSAFAVQAAADWDWPTLLDGISLLHLTGITPALGDAPAAAALAAARDAVARGIAVSFDVNYRASLWHGRADAAPATLRALAGHATVLFAGAHDLSLLLGDGADAPAAFAAFPRLRLLASTQRDVAALGATVCTATACTGLPPRPTGPVIERIGVGDAFAAGVLDAWLDDCDAATIAQRGLTLALLKGAIPGDAALVRREELLAAIADPRDIRR